MPTETVAVFITQICYLLNFTVWEDSNLDKGTSSISFALLWWIQTRTGALSMAFITLKT
jgi:hypothetical protein